MTDEVNNRQLRVERKAKAFERIDRGGNGKTAPFKTKSVRHPNAVALLEFGVFGLGLLERGDAGIGVFPKSEKSAICRAGFRRIT